MELGFAMVPQSSSSVQASYSCPCGCHPEVTSDQGAPVSVDTCCCGNEFAVGAGAEGRVTTAPGFRAQIQRFDAPWGEQIAAVWAIGPSVHAAEHEHSEHDTAGHAAHGSSASSGLTASATDPVCGMTVDPEAARGKGLHSSYQDRDYFFCGKGCKLEFDENPERYLDPSYQPSM